MKLTEERKEEILALCRKLIANRSYSGEEDGVAGALKYFMRQKKFDEITTDEYGNVLSASDIHGTECKIEYSDGGKISVSASSAQAVI